LNFTNQIKSLYTFRTYYLVVFLAAAFLAGAAAFLAGAGAAA